MVQTGIHLPVFTQVKATLKFIVYLVQIRHDIINYKLLKTNTKSP
jgi:hypothetical protein